MSIDAVIKSTMERKGDLWLRLGPRLGADGQSSIPGRMTLVIKGPLSKRPHPGQQIWGDAGMCIVEAGNGGERIEYTREGSILKEMQTDEQPNN